MRRIVTKPIDTSAMAVRKIGEDKLLEDEFFSIPKGEKITLIEKHPELDGGFWKCDSYINEGRSDKGFFLLNEDIKECTKGLK